MSRLEQLLKFLQEEPNDPFNIYAVAMEYQKTDAEKALTFFQLLLDQHADYVPTYYHVGKLYVEKDEVTKAKDTFEKGIEVCRKCSDLKAMRELQNALNELELD